jgi:hypothetical protein
MPHSVSRAPLLTPLYCQTPIGDGLFKNYRHDISLNFNHIASAMLFQFASYRLILFEFGLFRRLIELPLSVLSGKMLALTLVVFSLSAQLKLNGQITLSPEVGISYAPFTLFTASNDRRVTEKRLDYLIGLSGSVPVHERWSIICRVSYSDRENINWTENPICAVDINVLSHSDLNIDFSLRYHLLRKVSLWAGPSIVRKINSTLHTYTEPNNPCGYYSYTDRLDSFIYGFNLAASVNIQELIIKAEYAHINWEPEIFADFSGTHRYNLVLSYPLFTGKKR